MKRAKLPNNDALKEFLQAFRALTVAGLRRH